MARGKSQFLRNFVPFATLVVGAFVCLAQFRKVNYTEATVYKEQLAKVGLDEGSYQAQTTQSLEKEYQEMMKKIDLDNWQNIPGPQIGEDSRKKQEEIRKNRQNIKKNGD